MLLIVWPNECVATWRSSTLKKTSRSEEYVLNPYDPFDPAMPAEAEKGGTMLTFGAGAREQAGGQGAGGSASATDEDA